tara:strand:+ start:1018 stop:2415 length:1398 start_codon:yes stop_codon:yes gene_type:complete
MRFLNVFRYPSSLAWASITFGSLLIFCFPSISAEIDSLQLEQPGDGYGSTLEDFFTAAVDYSPKLKIAESRLDISSDRRRIARGQLLPQLSANANVSDNTYTNPSNPRPTGFTGERYSVQLSQILFDWRAFSVRKQATFDSSQAEAEYYYELSVLLTDVAEKYLDVLEAQDALTSIASELEAVENQLEQIQSLYNLQLTQITDLYQAQASLASVEAQQLRLQSELRLAEVQLRSVSGISVDNLFGLKPDINVPTVDHDIQHWVNEARENNQQIRALQFALKSANEKVSEKKGAYMPRVAFIAQQQDSNVGFENIPQLRTDNTFIGVNIQIPLYAGGSNKASISEARNQSNIVENQLRQLELDTNELVSSSYLLAQASQELTLAAQSLVDSTSISADAMQQGFELGTVTNVDVLNSLRDQYQAERELQRARYEQIKYTLILKRETGTLTSEDMIELGSLFEETSED